MGARYPHLICARVANLIYLVLLMRIAQIAPLIERVPPKKYGGTERVVSALTEELVRRGNDVTLFASGDSETSAKLEFTHPAALREGGITPLQGLYQGNQHILRLLGRAYARADEFDIIHDHTGTLGLPFAEGSRTPVVMTLHGNIDRDSLPLYEEFRRPHQVAISGSLRASVPSIVVADVIHNGLPMAHYPFSATPGNYLLYVGRICAEKGTHHAILAAKRLGLPLIIAAKLEKMERDQRYFRQYVKPHIGTDIRWVGEVDEAERNRLMAGAYCFLHPITWAEPFGLTMIEAMATGTPVVAFGRGSVPEVVCDGISGFVVDTFDELLAAVRKVPTLDRAAVRAYAISHFDAERMTCGYEELYHRIVFPIKNKITIISGLYFTPRFRFD